jgi:hypothetical protein
LQNFLSALPLNFLLQARQVFSAIADGMLNHFIEDNQYFIRVQTFTNDYSRKQTIKNRLRLFQGYIFVLLTNGAVVD